MLATLIEANPEYQNTARFGRASDMVRGLVSERLREVRKQSDLLGTKMLYRDMEAALGSAPIANDAI